MMKAANAFVKVDLRGDLAFIGRLICHRPSWYCRRSAEVALRADISLILIAAGSVSNQRYTNEITKARAMLAEVSIGLCLVPLELEQSLIH
jgi:hypothetical protein